MHFRTKDLMVAVLPEAIAAAERCYLHTKICLHPTICRYLTCKYLSCHHPVSKGCLCTYHITCGHGSCWQLSCGFMSPCPGFSDPCGLHSPYVVELPEDQVIDPIVVRNVEDIKALRADLEETLTRLKMVEEEGFPTATEGTADELRDLEAKMKEALQEIQAEIKKRG